MPAWITYDRRSAASSQRWHHRHRSLPYWGYRGWIQGFPGRIGTVFQTRTFAAPGFAAAPIAPGTKFGVSLSVHGQRLANGRLTLKRESAEGSAILERPFVGRRYFPSLAQGMHYRPPVDELVMVVHDNMSIVDVWSGDAELSLPEAIGEELHELAPAKMGVGYRFSMCHSIKDLKLLQNLTA
jgi:hypothetical protein